MTGGPNYPFNRCPACEFQGHLLGADWYVCGREKGVFMQGSPEEYSFQCFSFKSLGGKADRNAGLLPLDTSIALAIYRNYNRKAHIRRALGLRSSSNKEITQ